MAKKPDCWDIIEKADLDLNPELSAIFIDYEKKKEREKKSKRTQAIQNEIHVLTYVVEKGAPHWSQLRDWNRTARKLTAKEMGIINIACSIPRKIPTDKQAAVLVKAEKRAIDEGFYPQT